MTPLKSLISDRVRNVIVGELGFPVDRVTDDARLREDLGADSLNLYEIMFTLEEELVIAPPISDEEIEQIGTVADLIKLVEARTGAAANA